MRRLLALVVVALACGPHAAEPTPTTPPDAGAPAVDAGTRIAIDGDPNGLLWDEAAQVLLVADGDGNRILRWSDAAGVEEHVRLPGDSAGGRGLGQLLRQPDGSLVVTVFGRGEAGGIVVIRADGTAEPIAGLDPSRRRIGLARAPDGTLYTAWFEKHGDTRVGMVARVDLGGGGEKVVIEGLQKPVGLVVQGDALFIADQRLGQILRAPLADLAHPTPWVASIEEPDLLCAGPDGALFTGGKNGEVRRIDPGGKVTVVAKGFSTVRGVAYDPKGRRLFVAEHAGKDDAAKGHAIHIVPLE